jgi:hypothetical protein
MATVSNLFVDQGSYFSRFINITTPAGSAFDLTNYTVASQMRKSAASSIAYTIPCSIVDPLSGKIKLRLDAASTDNIPAGRYLYDIEVTDATGEKLRVLEGIIFLLPQMTRV